MELISSTKNQVIKDIKLLRNKRSKRHAAGLFWVEGAREISRAIQCGYAPKNLLICKELLNDESRDITNESTIESPITVTEAVYNSLAVRQNQEGLLVAFAIKAKSLQQAKLQTFFIIENLEKPGNLGALLRSCDGAGLDGIILTENSVDLYNANVIRASLGTAFSVPCYQATNQEALDYCQQTKAQLCMATPAASQKFTDGDYTKATAFILGNEATGLSDFWLSQSATKISIPMQGIADSLNISVAGALLAYEANRQKS